MIDDILSKDDKDKRVNSKCQAFIWQIDNKEMVVGLLIDLANWSASGVDAVSSLELSACGDAGTGLPQVWKCKNWSTTCLEMH